ncbi:MAG: hypothetical protein EOP49_47365 [Sphingobacteriales bacterium]|nr:MAG: hypothetical protein EOP49_47365 [Sphingobacteriales bacterium]
MRGAVIIVTVVFSIHFLVKWKDYSSLVRTTGTVVGHGTMSYGMIRGGSQSVTYPIVAFRYAGPVMRKKVDMDEVIHAMDWGQVKGKDLGQELARKEKELQQQYTDTPGVVNTGEPQGALFYWEYPVGETMSVIYKPGQPQDAVVLSFFSYWLTLKAMLLLPVICIFLIGLANIPRMKERWPRDGFDTALNN